MLIDGFKGRTVSLGDKVRVYRNLNNGKWSVKALDGEHKNKVVAHFDSLTLCDVAFVISEAGRMRVLKEKRKNVHAYAQGYLVSIEPTSMQQQSEFITYDPYKCGFFYKSSHDSGRVDTLKTLNFIAGKAFT